MSEQRDIPFPIDGSVWCHLLADITGTPYLACEIMWWETRADFESWQWTGIRWRAEQFRTEFVGRPSDAESRYRLRVLLEKLTPKEPA